MDAEGYVYDVGDVLLLTFKYVTRNNVEKELVVSLDKNGAERLKGLLEQRVLPPREE